jgi:hypothetical protein
MNGPPTTLQRLRIGRIRPADICMARFLKNRILESARNDMSGAT